MAQTHTPSAVSRAVLCTIAGRIDHVSSRDTNGATTYRTLVTVPALDEYSSPGQYEIRSRKRVGRPGDTIAQACQLRGYKRSFETKAGEQVKTAEHVLEAVEE